MLFVVKDYYLREQNILIAILHHDEDKDLFSMEIENPKLFTGRLDKLFMTDNMVRKWMESRLTPEYQKGYAEIMVAFGLDTTKKDHRWQLFLYTRGCNIKDKMWLALSEDEKYEDGLNPLYRVFNPQLYPNEVGEIYD